jgi:hypothetical protein
VEGTTLEERYQEERYQEELRRLRDHERQVRATEDPVFTRWLQAASVPPDHPAPPGAAATAHQGTPLGTSKIETSARSPVRAGHHTTTNRPTMAITQPPAWSRPCTGLSGSPLRIRTRALLGGYNGQSGVADLKYVASGVAWGDLPTSRRVGAGSSPRPAWQRKYGARSLMASRTSPAAPALPAAVACERASRAGLLR